IWRGLMCALEEGGGAWKIALRVMNAGHDVECVGVVRRTREDRGDLGFGARQIATLHEFESFGNGAHRGRFGHRQRLVQVAVVHARPLRRVTALRRWPVRAILATEDRKSTRLNSSHV